MLLCASTDGITQGWSSLALNLKLYLIYRSEKKRLKDKVLWTFHFLINPRFFIPSLSVLSACLIKKKSRNIMDNLFKINWHRSKFFFTSWCHSLLNYWNFICFVLLDVLCTCGLDRCRCVHIVFLHFKLKKKILHIWHVCIYCIITRTYDTVRVGGIIMYAAVQRSCNNCF